MILITGNLNSPAPVTLELATLGVFLRLRVNLGILSHVGVLKHFEKNRKIEKPPTHSKN